MSMETLRADLKANMQQLAALGGPGTTADDIAKHLREVLWPTLESVVDEMESIDGCVEDMLSGSEDILQPETGEKFAAIIVGAAAVATALRSRITREAEPQLSKVIDELLRNCKTGEEILEEIVVDADDIDDDETDDEDGDEGDDDEDDSEGATP